MQWENSTGNKNADANIELAECENSTANDGKILPEDGRILPKDGKLVPAKKVFKKVFKKALSRVQTCKQVFTTHSNKFLLLKGNIKFMTSIENKLKVNIEERIKKAQERYAGNQKRQRCQLCTLASNGMPACKMLKAGDNGK